VSPQHDNHDSYAHRPEQHAQPQQQQQQQHQEQYYEAEQQQEEQQRTAVTVTVHLQGDSPGERLVLPPTMEWEEFLAACRAALALEPSTTIELYKQELADVYADVPQQQQQQADGVADMMDVDSANSQQQQWEQQPRQELQRRQVSS
jgi:hypothetical protein